MKRPEPPETREPDARSDPRGAAPPDPRTGPVGSPAPSPHAAPTLESPPGRSFADVSRPLEGRVLAGKYRLEGRLGHGGMGEVYGATHLALGTRVAVKILHPHLAAIPEAARRFQREARAASSLTHANVVKVVDYGEDGDVPFLVMEFLEGLSVADWLGDQDAPPPLALVRGIVLGTLAALEAAHGAGIVHRDLKPDNVFLAFDSANELTVKVVDFGLAHFDDSAQGGTQLTQSGMVAGTPHYMSPEQCRSLAVGPSADLYALGCLLTALLQLEPPFDGESWTDVISKQLFVPPPPLARPPGAEAVPPLLERLRLELLAKDAADRPRDAAEVRARLLESLSPVASAARLPARKELGAPGRSAAGAPVPAPDPAAPTAVAVVTLGADARIDDRCATGLAAHHFLIHRAARDAAISEARAAVLDAGADVEGALRWLASRTSGAAPVVVCLDALDPAAVTTFVAAGAADVLVGPPTPDKLARKLARLLRKSRS